MPADDRRLLAVRFCAIIGCVETERSFSDLKWQTLRHNGIAFPPPHDRAWLRRPDTRDLLQEVFVRVFRTLKTFRAAEGSFTTWLSRVSRNLLIDHYRRTRQDREHTLQVPIKSVWVKPLHPRFREQLARL